MRAHLIQMDTAWEDRPANRRRAKALLDRATQTQGLAPGDLAVLPELFDTGFSFNLAVTADADGSTQRFICEEAGRRQITLVGSRTVLGPDGRGRNRCTVAGPDGAIICEYDKVHPFSFGKEGEHFTGGSRVMLFEWEAPVVEDPTGTSAAASGEAQPDPAGGGGSVSNSAASQAGSAAGGAGAGASSTGGGMTWAERVRSGLFTGPTEAAQQSASQQARAGFGRAGAERLGPGRPGPERAGPGRAGLARAGTGAAGGSSGSGKGVVASSLAFVPYMRVCPTICYDLRFPELYRYGMLSGAEVFTVIANWPQARAAHRRALCVARAIENQAVVLCVNRAGNDPHLKYAGESFAIGPKGETLGEAGPEECVLSVTIDAASVRAWRAEFPAWRDVKLLG